MMLKKTIWIIPLLIVSLSCIAYSQTMYKWIDHQGNIHFTSNYDSIPPEYRNQVHKPGIDEEADTTKEIQREKEGVSSPVISPLEQRPEIEAAPSLSHSQGKSRKTEKGTRPKVEFEGRYWITDLTAEAKVIESGIGTGFDLKDDLGLKDENFPDARFTWYTGPKSKVRLAYTQVAYGGKKNIERTIEFNGKTYTAGTRVVTDLDVYYLRLGWVWQFITIANGKVKLGTLIEAKGFLVDICLDAPNLIPPVKESEEFVGGLPTVGAALDINPHKIVNIFAEVSGIHAGEYGYFLDGEAGVKIIPIKNLSILGGYRIFYMKAEDDPDFARLRISGPFVGATLRF